MKTPLLITSIILVLLLVALVIRSVSQKELPKKEIIIHGAAFRVDLADTEMSRMVGLSGRKSLGENEGMLFVFPVGGQYAFWMKGMNFPLDFVWISKGSVIQITENVPKPTSTLDFATYGPSAPVDQVLEINSGAVARAGIQVGDIVEIK